MTGHGANPVLDWTSRILATPHPTTSDPLPHSPPHFLQSGLRICISSNITFTKLILLFFGGGFILFNFAESQVFK